jgi:hypothetical protein
LPLTKTGRGRQRLAGYQQLELEAAQTPRREAFEPFLRGYPRVSQQSKLRLRASNVYLLAL